MYPHISYLTLVVALFAASLVASPLHIATEQEVIENSAYTAIQKEPLTNDSKIRKPGQPCDLPKGEVCETGYHCLPKYSGGKEMACTSIPAIPASTDAERGNEKDSSWYMNRKDLDLDFGLS
ncbi:hypothetical protein TWF694_004328 [Orbilia ellipsospora]|uniref:Uncharacterized protein n=1 Tax=Orbilia ellipsospora TaxID=2528407 RepID=A0AAV9WYN2_9PEZI